MQVRHDLPTPRPPTPGQSPPIPHGAARLYLHDEEVVAGLEAGAPGFVFATPKAAAVASELRSGGPAEGFITAPYPLAGFNPWTNGLGEHLRGAREITIVAEHGPGSIEFATTASGDLREQLGPEAKIAVCRTRAGAETFADHVAAISGMLGARPALREAIGHLEVPDTASTAGIRTASDIMRQRTGLIDRFLATEAPAIEWVVEGLIPAGVEGGLIAAGGTGKGLFEIMLALHVALGVDCGPFSVEKPRGVVLLALEDDPEALHRRFRAAIATRFPDLTPEQDAQLDERIEIKDLRGARGANLSDDFVELAIEAAGQVPEVGVIFFDPLTRGLDLREGTTLNSQEGGGMTIAQLGKIAAATGAAVIYAHHVNKRSRMDGTELAATAATGSQQLVDLSRFVINMMRLTEPQAVAFGLDTEEGRRRFVQIAVSKSNGPDPGPGPYVLEVLPIGAVEWRQEARGRALEDDERVFAAIVQLVDRHGRPATCEEILDAVQPGMGERRVQKARRRLEKHGEVERRARAVSQDDGSLADGFEPAPDGAERLAERFERGGGDAAGEAGPGL